MNKKATRLLSVLLAVLMVVTMVPFMALSAAEPVALDADPVVWDGLVPNLNGVEATVEDWIFGTGAAADQTFKFDWYGEEAENADDIVYDEDTETITIKTAGGLALFTVWSNVNSTDGFDDYGVGEEATHPLVFLQGKTVKLAADLYLNDPAVDSAEWTNTTMPIFWDNINLGDATQKTSFVFDGAGYMVYGWNVAQTIEYDETNCQNIGWGFFGTLPQSGEITVKNLALIDAQLALTATIYTYQTTIWDADDNIPNKTEGEAAHGVTTVMAGGICGYAPQAKSFLVDGCVVDINFNIQVNGGGTTGAAGNPNPGLFAGGIHSHMDLAVKHYPEEKQEKTEDQTAPNTVSTADTWRAANRYVKNCIISVEGKTSAGGWRAFTAGVGVDGYYNNVKLDDIIIAGFNVAGTTDLDAIISHGMASGSNTKANRGIVSVAGGTMPADPSCMTTTLLDLAISFEETVQTELTDARDGRTKSFETWHLDAGFPLPVQYNAAEFIADFYSPEIYRISTPEEFMAWKDNLDYDVVVLDADIDMAGYDWTPIESWGGVFDGNGHTVYNLTSTAQGGYYGSHNETQNMRGGLVNKLAISSVFKNVAFLNMTFNCSGYDCNVHAGMLVGYYGSCNLTVDNVVIAGRNDGKGGVYMGMFGGRANNSARAYINDCAFICTDPATSKFLSNFAGGAKDAWGSNSDVFVTNFYGVNVPAQRELAFCGNNQSAGRFTTMTNGYMTGAKDYTYFVSHATDGYDKPWTYSSSSEAATAFYAGIEGDEVVKADFVGEALALGDAWTYADGLLPVPKCFDASVAEVLTATNGIKVGGVSDYLTFTGASIRLSQLAEKQGIRFSFATTAALDLLAKNTDVYYGVLVAPTALIGEELNDEDEKAILFANLEGGDAVLDVVDGKFNAALVNFAGVTTVDVRTVSFTVRGFVMIGEQILWLDSYACSAAEVAAAYIAENAGSEDAEVLATIEKIEAIYSDLLAE